MKYEVKHNLDMRMGHLWLNGWSIYHIMGRALWLNGLDIYDLMDGVFIG